MPILLGRLVVHAVHIERGGRFLGEIEQFRRSHLHPERQLVGSDTGGDFRHRPSRPDAPDSDRGPHRARALAGLAAHALGIATDTESDRPNCATGSPGKSTAEIRSRNSTRRRSFPRPKPARRRPGRFFDSLPRPYTTQAPIVGRPNCIEPRKQQQLPWMMIECVRVHGSNHAEIIGHLRCVRQIIREHHPALPELLELRGLASTAAVGLMNASFKSLVIAGGRGLPCHFFSAGFGSNRSIWLGPPSMKRKMTFLAFGAKCGFSRRKRIRRLGARPCQQVRQRDHAESAAGILQKGTP